MFPRKRRYNYHKRRDRSRSTEYIKNRLFNTFRYKWGLGVVLHKFRKETGKIVFTYDDFISWYMENWHRFHRKPLSSQSIGRALRLFAEMEFVIIRDRTSKKRAIFKFKYYA